MSGARPSAAFQRKQQAADALPSALTQSGHWRAQQRIVKQTSAYFELGLCCRAQHWLTNELGPRPFASTATKFNAAFGDLICKKFGICSIPS